MSRVLVVLGHGRRESLCHHLAGVAQDEMKRRGAEVRVHDLLADRFDPVLRLEPHERHATATAMERDPIAHRYQQDVRWADAYVFVHPVWWFAPPAILKGWIDRILVHEVAIQQHDDGPPTPLLVGRRALLVQTFNSPRLLDLIAFGGTTGRFWKRVVFASTGIRPAGRVALYGAEQVEADAVARTETRLRTAIARLLEVHE